jgi:site-specific DNA recombinase
MIAAIYARKSTDQSGVSDDQRSVARQVEHARAYAERKGWTVADEHVYVDDGISGAEFANRPGFLRLMNALKPRAPFQALVMSEESRLGREAIETAYALKQLVQAGVRVFFYLEDRERTLGSPTDKILMSLTAFADELEREKARQRTYDAMQRKARAGHVTGGRVFGFDNVEVLAADGQRSHVQRKVNEPEAAVVRRIFRLCADGAGLTRITKLLNAEGAVSPRAQRGRPQAWAPSSVRAVLQRPLYRGEIVWNQTRKRDSWGQQRQKDRPKGEWLHVPAPELRIVDEELWHAAERQMAARRLQSGIVPGVDRRGARGLPQDRDSHYLLTSFARCGCCGGSMAAHTRSHGGKRVAFYGCLTYWKKGKSRCSNGLAGRLDVLDAELLETLKDDILRPTVVQRALELALDELTPAAEPAAVEARGAQIAALEAECARLAEAIARGGRLDVLLRMLEDRQNRLGALRAEQAAATAIVRPVFDRRGMEGRLRYLLEDWRALLTRDVPTGREVLRTLLVEPMTFTPIIDGRRRGYRFEGAIALDRLVSKAVTLPTFGTSPTGFEPVFQP